MSIAADAVSDIIAPPPPRAAANAPADDRQAPSFQEHLDDARQGEERPAPSSNEKPQARAAAGSDPATASAPSAKDDDAASEDQVASLHPPVLVQLIASAPAQLGASLEEAAGKQSAAEAGQAQDANAAQLAATAAATTPVLIAPKPNVTARPQQVKTASTKDAPEETAAVATEGADDSTTPTPEVNAAMVAPVTAPPTAPRSDGDQLEAIGAIADTSKRAAAPPHEAPTPSSAAQTPPVTPEAAQPADTAKAAPRAKDIAQADLFKQLAQDAAAPAPKPPMTANTSPAVSHPQLAAPAQQAPATDAAMRATPQAAAQVGSEIIRRFNGQDTSFQLRLDPPELGRVDIRLDVSRDHRVTAIISADSPQALSDLARGARDLQQALQSAGLDLADDGLRFDLSSNGQGNSFAQAQADQPAWRATPDATPNQAATPEPIATRPLSIDSWRGARVDLMA